MFNIHFDLNSIYFIYYHANSRGEVIFFICVFIRAAFNLLWCFSAALSTWSLGLELFKARMICDIFELFLFILLGEFDEVLILLTTLFFKTYLSPWILLNSSIRSFSSWLMSSLLDFLLNFFIIGDLDLSASNNYYY